WNASSPGNVSAISSTLTCFPPSRSLGKRRSRTASSAWATEVTARTSHPPRSYGSGTDQPGAHDGLVLVEHGGLAGGDGVGRFGELEREPVRRLSHQCAERRGAIPE